MPDLDRYGGSKAWDAHCFELDDRRDRQLAAGECSMCKNCKIADPNQFGKHLSEQIAFCYVLDDFVQPDWKPLDMGCEDDYEDGD